MFNKILIRHMLANLLCVVSILTDVTEVTRICLTVLGSSACGMQMGIGPGGAS